MLYFACLLLISLISPLIGTELAFARTFRSQIQKEFFASNVYLTFAHRLAYEGIYQGFAEFFFESAEEERDHGKHLIDFYNLRDYPVQLKLMPIQINETLAAKTKLPEMIRAATILEENVLDSLNNVRLLAKKQGDYSAIHFIEKYLLEEQVLAVKLMKDLRQRLVQAGESSLFLQMMDRELRKKQIKKA